MILFSRAQRRASETIPSRACSMQGSEAIAAIRNQKKLGNGRFGWQTEFRISKRSKLLAKSRSFRSGSYSDLSFETVTESSITSLRNVSWTIWLTGTKPVLSNLRSISNLSGWGIVVVSSALETTKFLALPPKRRAPLQHECDRNGADQEVEWSWCERQPILPWRAVRLRIVIRFAATQGTLSFPFLNLLNKA